MKKYINVILATIVLACVGLSATSCSSDNEEQQTRLFRPVSFGFVATTNSIDVSWTYIEGAVSYTLEVYTSSSSGADVIYSLFATYEPQVNSQSVEGLASDKNYYFRVRANAADTQYSSYFTALTSQKTEI